MTCSEDCHTHWMSSDSERESEDLHSDSGRSKGCEIDWFDRVKEGRLPRVKNTNGVTRDESAEGVANDGETIDLSSVESDLLNFGVDFLDDAFSAQIDPVVGEGALREGRGEDDEFVLFDRR